MKKYFLQSIKKISFTKNFLLQLPKILSTRRVYERWQLIFQSDGYDLDRMIHPIWKKVQPEAERVLMNNKKLFAFLSSPDLQFMFYRMGFSDRQRFELNYLKNTPKETWQSILEYSESPIGKPKFDCEYLNISVNSLGMLYYWAAIASKWDIKTLNTVVEVGGGYGCFCRVVQEMIFPRITYIMFDLPEMLALQYYFLSGSSTEYKIIPHFSSSSNIIEGAINLVPIHYLSNFKVNKYDLIVSHFALSETTKYIQHLVSEKLFSKTKYLYMTIQDTDSAEWNELGLEPTVNLLAMIKNSFSQINTFLKKIDRIKVGPGLVDTNFAALRAL